MNWDRVEGNWKQIKGKVQQKWGKLTNDDLNLVEGKRTELVGRIQERYGIERNEAEQQIDSWLRNLTRADRPRAMSRAAWNWRACINSRYEQTNIARSRELDPPAAWREVARIVELVAQ